jgi:hypothetical protein
MAAKSKDTTEDTGQDSTAAPLPPEDADPQDVAEEAAAAEPAAAEQAPVPPTPAWLVDVERNAPAWIADGFRSLHDRLVNLGG